MDDLELIKQKINIVDLIQEYLPLKKTGINYKANCPFHQEKTPSFVVSPERGIWRCFGCNRGGSIFDFIMEKEGLDFPEALEVLARRAGVTLSKKSSAKKDGRERLYQVNQLALEFFHHILTKHPLGKKALTYLKGRGLTDQTISEFKLGYAPNSWETLTKLLLKRGFNQKEVIEAGLIVPSQKGGYDRFRGRTIFPLIDSKDQVIGFAGRVLDQGEPKYINTPQTPIFDKGKFLFGLNLTKGEIRQQKEAILVEGEMDMLLSFQSGVKNIIASKGTALTLGQIDLIKKYTDNILLCFDHDLAGDSAARRGIELADQAGLNIKVINLSGGKDPAEIVQKNPKAWQELVEKAVSIYDYYFDSSLKRHDLKTAQGKKEIVQELLPIISKISDLVTQEHHLENLSTLVSVPEELLRKKLKGQTMVQTPKYQEVLKKPEASVGPRSRREILEEYLLALLLKVPSSLTFVPKFPETIFQNESYKTLFVMFVIYLDTISFKAKTFKIDDLIKSLPDQLVGLVDGLYLVEIDEKLTNPKDWQQEVETVVAELKKALIKATLQKLSAQIKFAQSFGKLDQLEILNRRFRDLSLKLKNL